MGAESKIAWTHHTFNPWMGCAKVSEACKHCLGDRSHGADPREWPADLRVQEFPR